MDDLFYLSLLLIGGSELAFHSVLPGWITYGGIPAVLLYVAVFVAVRRRRRSSEKPGG